MGNFQLLQRIPNLALFEERAYQMDGSSEDVEETR